MPFIYHCPFKCCCCYSVFCIIYFSALLVYLKHDLLALQDFVGALFSPSWVYYMVYDCVTRHCVIFYANIENPLIYNTFKLINVDYLILSTFLTFLYSLYSTYMFNIS